MRVTVPARAVKRAIFTLVVVIASVLLLFSSSRPSFTVHQKAYYADANLVDFVRPGLSIKILSAQIKDDGTIITNFQLTDPQGLPLDREGITTPGAVSTSFVAAYIPNDQSQYVAYTVRPQTSPITNVTAVQASSDSGGTYTKIADGQYQYTFGTKAPANFDKTATHSIGVYSSRNLTEFDLGTNFADAVFTFVPDGSKVTHVHDEINTSSCNKCHDPLQAHGGSRRTIQLCVLCHTPQTVDPDTGNTVDMPVMIHKIHMGAQLPSVQAGKPYEIIGHNQSVHNFSEVVDPADVRNCQFCHEPGPSQADVWLTKPSRKACGACHDNVNFATGENHVDLPELNDNECSTCHIPQGELPFDASIIGAHTIPRFAPGVPGVVFTLVKVDDGVVGKKPTVTFSVKDKAGNPILPSNMDFLQLVLAGPSSDYASVISEDVRQAAGSTDGTYTWTFQNPIPSTAKGTYTVGIEGYRNFTLLPGTLKEQTVRDVGVNKILNFSVDGSPIVPRRTVVKLANCNSCHFSLAAHGTIRNQTDYCVLCHNPNATDHEFRPASQSPPESIDFVTLIHKIHTGENLEIPYVVYGYRGSVNNFNEVLFPGDRRDCTKCHVNNSQQLPLPADLLPVVNPRGFINPEGPTAAACLGCHTAKDSAAHAALMTSSTLGESCAVCHGQDADFSVNKVHAR
jgi:OmcA/MtrC family decaheme c-type cytochrome